MHTRDGSAARKNRPNAAPAHVGLGATAPTTYNEPFTAARAFASPGHLSAGRAAWNAATSSSPDAAGNFGRNPAALSILPGVMPVLDGTQAAAERKLDAPVPDLPLPDASHGFARTMLAKDRREGMTLRDLYGLTAAARGHWVLCGTPETNDRAGRIRA